MRSTIYVLGGAPATDERNFKRMRASRAELEPDTDFKHLLREQLFIIVKYDREAAAEAIPTLLKGLGAAEIDAQLEHIQHVLAASGELSPHAADRFARMKTLFLRGRPQAPAPSGTNETSSADAAADTHSRSARRKASPGGASTTRRRTRRVADDS